MGVEHRILRSSVFKGLNKTSNQLLLSSEYATYLKNMSLRDSGAIEKRKGFHAISKKDNSATENAHQSSNLLETKDLFTFQNISNADGSITNELLRIYRDNLQKLDQTYTLNIPPLTNTPDDVFPIETDLITSASFYVSELTNNFTFEVFSGTRSLVKVDLGKGDDSDITVEDLVTILDTTTIPRILPVGDSFTIDSKTSYTDPVIGDVWIYKIPNWQTTIPTVDSYTHDPSDPYITVGISTQYGPVFLDIEQIDNDFIYLRTQNSTEIDTEILNAEYFYKGSIDVTYTNNVTNDTQYSYISTPTIATTLKAACMNLEPVGSLSYGLYQWTDITDYAPFAHERTYDNTGVGPFLGEGVYPTTVVTGLQEQKHITHTSLNNVMYFADGHNYLLKYDGDKVYRAGLPSIPRNPDEYGHILNSTTKVSVGFDIYNSSYTLPNYSGQTVGSGGMTPGIRTYMIQLEYTDKKGNIISSTTSKQIEVDSSAKTSNVSHTLAWGSLVKALELPGYYITNPTFDGSNNCIDGDAPFWGFDTEGTFDQDTFPGLPDTYDPTWDLGRKARTKLRGDKRLRVKIWRTRAQLGTGAPGSFLLVADLKYDYGSYTVGADPETHNGTYTDVISDDMLSEFGLNVLLENNPAHNPAPKGSCLTDHRGLNVLSGNKNDVNNVYYSLPKNTQTFEIGSEYFPINNSVIVESPFGGKINALESLGDLIYVFHDESVSVIGGDIEVQALPATNLVTKEGGIGCLSPRAVMEFNGKLYFISNVGSIFSISNQGLIEESEIVKTLFSNITDFTMYRARCFNWQSGSKLLFCIPKEEQVGAPGEGYHRVTSDKLIVAYDYTNNAWMEWDNIDFIGGIATFKQETYFAPQLRSIDIVNKISETGTFVDYSDNEDSIDFNYTSNWESLGEPTIPKKFLRLKVYAIDNDNTFECPGFELNVGVQREFLDGNIANIKYDFGIDNEGYGESAWGSFTWGDAIPYMFRSKLPTKKTKSLRLVFTNNKLNENVLITSWETETALTFGTEIK